MATKNMEWDLSDLYQGIDDPAIRQDMVRSDKAADKFAAQFRGKINDKLSAEVLLDALKKLEKILTAAVRPQLYASLLFSKDTRNESYGALMQSTAESYIETGKKLLFFELDLAKLSDKALKRLGEDKKLVKYRHYILRQLDFKKHRLSEAEEKILADKEQTSRSAFSRLFEQLISAKKFRFALGSRQEELSEPQILDLLHDSDREVRKAAAAGIAAGLKEELPKLSFIYNTLGQDKKINDHYRKFATPEDSRHLDNEVEREAVEALVTAVRDNYSIVSDYYAFKSRVSGIRRLYDYDRYAPATSSAAKMDFLEGRKIVLDAFGSFDPEFKAIADEFFRNRWIDAKLKPGKRGGAYCSYLTPDLHPYVFLNYQDKISDVETLAHELGHAIHGYLMREQTLLNFDSPLTLAETASVFAEMLVFDHLKKILPPKERLALIMRTIEGLIASVFRQISMFLFERRFHEERRKGEVPSERINELWLETQREMFQGSVVLTPDYGSWWSYIPHFFETPFYVYAYSFGQLLTLSLYNRYQNDPGFPVRYKEFLRAGNSKSPQELLSGLGVDVSDPTFWQEGLDSIKNLIIEAKETYSRL